MISCVSNDLDHDYHPHPACCGRVFVSFSWACGSGSVLAPPLTQRDCSATTDETTTLRRTDSRVEALDVFLDFLGHLDICVSPRKTRNPDQSVTRYDTHISEDLPKHHRVSHTYSC